MAPHVSESYVSQPLRAQRLDAETNRLAAARETERWWKLRNRRGAVERAFKLAKHEHRLDALRTRGLARARRHVDMVYIAWLALASCGHAVPQPL